MFHWMMNLHYDNGAAGGGAQGSQAGTPAPGTQVGTPVPPSPTVSPEAFAALQKQLGEVTAKLADAEKPRELDPDPEKIRERAEFYKSNPKVWAAQQAAMGAAASDAEKEALKQRLAALENYKTQTELGQLKTQMLTTAGLPLTALPLLTGSDAETLKQQIETLKATLAGQPGAGGQQPGQGVQYPAMGGDNKPVPAMSVSKAWEHAVG